MTIKILCFGITRDIVGGFEYQTELPEGGNIQDLKQLLTSQFPDFQKLTSLRIAVNTEYAEDDTPLKENDEIVLIPPVSGG